MDTRWSICILVDRIITFFSFGTWQLFFWISLSLHFQLFLFSTVVLSQANYRLLSTHSVFNVINRLRTSNEVWITLTAYLINKKPNIKAIKDAMCTFEHLRNSSILLKLTAILNGEETLGMRFDWRESQLVPRLPVAALVESLWKVFGSFATLVKLAVFSYNVKLFWQDSDKFQQMPGRYFIYLCVSERF